MTRVHRQQPLAPIFAALSIPRIFAITLHLIQWPDIHALLISCSAARSLFRSPDIRDLILSRFVPGYQFCILHGDQRREHDVYVSIHDLDLFLISIKFPLHYYPTYALRALSLCGQAEQNTRLAALAQAHSRFVLLLQSLVHRSDVPINPEPREHLSPLPILLRQLTFPAPLSYDPDPRLPNNSLPKSSSRPSFVDTLSYRRLPLFRANSPIPPPPAEPRALKGYTNSWRNTLFHHHRRSSSDVLPHQRRPQRRNWSADSTTSTSASTSIPSPLSASRSPTPTPTTPSPSSSPPPPSFPPISISYPASPHDLSLALSRARAPVLRAYVPCTELLDGSISVLRCEEQLLQSGLWSHLSAGDIVCNLGYVPDSDSDEALPLDGSNGSGSFKSWAPSSLQNEYRQKWLIFNGSFLVPFTPGALPLPLDDPLSIPSPFYYAHILPSSPLANPVFVIPRIPVPDRLTSKAPIMTLQLLSTKVPSPPSPSGVAIARKYMWTATVELRRCSRNDDRERDLDEESEEHDIGDGWYGDWVLETEGTKEGRQVLLDWLGGGYVGPPREWELVRERSGVSKKDSKGTVWLKLLPSREFTPEEDWDGDEDEIPPSPLTIQARL